MVTIPHRQDVFTRSEANPLLTAADMPVSAEAVLNPGAVEHDGQVVLLLRLEDSSGLSSIYVARSRNGVDDWKIEPTPLLAYGLKEWRYEEWGCEDARVMHLPGEDLYYITYTAYSPAGAAVGLAKTRDFHHVERVGLIFSPNNKDAALLPQKFGGRWAVLHRPDAGGGIENIWSAYSPDLVHWGEPHAVLLEGIGPAWDAGRVGAGPPPVLTKHGWLLLYHGVKMYAGMNAYRVGLAMLDKDKPHKIKARSPRSVFKAAAIYEQSGLVPNVVFPTGLIQRGDELWMYYGAADTCVCLATARLDDVLDRLET